MSPRCDGYGKRGVGSVCVQVCVCAVVYFVFTASVCVRVCVLAPSALLLGELLCFTGLFQLLIVCLIHLEINLDLILDPSAALPRNPLNPPQGPWIPL